MDRIAGDRPAEIWQFRYHNLARDILWPEFLHRRFIAPVQFVYTSSHYFERCMKSRRNFFAPHRNYALTAVNGHREPILGGFDLDHLRGLIISVITHGFETGPAELCRNVLRRQIEPAGRSAA